MLRICLIVAIVAGLAAGGVSLVKVREVMLQTMNDRDQFLKERKEENAGRLKAEGKLKTTEAELKTTKEKLASTESELKTVTAKAEDLDKQKTELTSTLEKTRADRDTAQQALMRWDLLGVTIDQVKQLQVDIKKVAAERDAFVKENKIIIQKRNELQAKLDYFFGPDRPVELPAGLKGKVLRVDDKFQFVVLDIGGEQGVLERGEMLVKREGRLIGKVRIATVDKNTSIANILPGWKQSDMSEGDAVIY